MSEHDPTLPPDPDRTRIVGPQTAPGAAAADLPARIGRYRPLRILGQGGMGVVYEAEQDQPRRRVALKVIRPELATADLRRRFAHESLFLARLQHPGIAQVYEAGTAETDRGLVPFIAMELVAGAPLADWAEREQPDLATRLELMIRLCDAVQHAHQRGLIHRDLKPANILVDAMGRPRILDFGVARPADADLQTSLVTTHGELIGTVAYMSPEQLVGDPNDLDTRSDVYALGVILYELLAGRPPLVLTGRPLEDALRAIREDEPPPLSVHDSRLAGDLSVIAAKAMAKDRDQRYASANGLAMDLQRHLDDEPIAARPPSTVYLMHKFARRHRPLVIGIAGVAVALVLGVVVSTWQAVRATRAESLAADRLDQAETVTGFLQDMLAAIQPEEARGREVTVREVLDRAAVDLAGGSLADRPLVESALRRTLGKTYRSLGEFEDSEQQLRRGVALADSLYAADDPARLELRLDLAHTLRNRGQSGAAEALALEVLARNPQRNLVAVSALDILATVRYEQGQWQAADSLQQEIQSFVMAEGAPDSLHLAEVLLSRAFLAEQRRDLDLAETMTSRAVAIKRTAHGAEDPRMITGLSRLGDIARKQGRLQDALQLHEEAHAIAAAVYGADHPSRADALFRLGQTHDALQDHDAALAAYTECLRIRRAAIGPVHRDIALALSSLGQLHSVKGQFDAAEAYLLEALALREQIFGLVHVAIASSRQDLGLLAQRRRDPVLAVTHFERAQAVLDQLPDGAQDLSQLNAFYIAMALQDQGEHAAAEPHFRRALAILQAAHPGPQQFTATALSNLATNLFRQGRKEEAAAIQQEALTMSRTVGVAGRGLWLALGNTAFMLDDAGRHEEATPLHAEILAVSIELYGEQQVTTLDSRSRFCDNLARRGLWAEALAQAELVVAWRQEHLPPDDVKQVTAAAQLAEALGGLGRAAEADSVLTVAEDRLATLDDVRQADQARVLRVREALSTQLDSR